MALKSTIYNFDIVLSDVDRGVYESLKCGVAMHPSETAEFMAVRVLAYCLEYEEGLSFSKGLSDGDEPALWMKYLDGRIKSWIEVGAPTAARLHRASKLAERVAIYTHKPPAALIGRLAGELIHRGDEIPVYSFDQTFLRQLSSLIERRNTLNISVNERQLYLDIRGTSLFSAIAEQIAAP